MSAKATFWAWEQSIKQGPKLVLLALADSANDDGQCWPGYGEIKRKTGINSDATIASHLRDLEAAGLVSVENRYGTRGGAPCKFSNIYQLPVTSKSEVTITSKFEEESNKESNKESKSIYRKLSLADVPEKLRDPVREFIDHRINLKKPLTPQALSRFITTATNTAGDLGLPIDGVIRETIDAGWQSVKTEWLANRLGCKQRDGPQKSRRTSLTEDLTDTSWAH